MKCPKSVLPAQHHGFATTYSTASTAAPTTARKLVPSKIVLLKLYHQSVPWCQLLEEQCVVAYATTVTAVPGINRRLLSSVFSIQPFSQALLFNYNDRFVKCGSTWKTDSIKIRSWSSCLLHLNDFQIKRSQFTSKKDVLFVFPTTRSTKSCWDLEVMLSYFWLVQL